MELIKEEKNKKIYSEDNKIYTVFDMESYVGHSTWKLMVLDETVEDDKIHIEALVDVLGDYMQIMADSKGTRRVLGIRNGMIYNDSVSELPITVDGLFFTDTYYALNDDKYSENIILLTDYLSVPHEYTLDDKKYEGEIPSNDLFINFIAKDEEIRKEIYGKQK